MSISEAEFTESLSRCKSCSFTGGKSGALFLQTLDDRFLLKQLSRSDLDSFITFAPHYFEFVSKAHQNSV